MSDLIERASAILKEFKGDRYAFGSGVLDGAPGKFAAEFGKKALVMWRQTKHAFFCFDENTDR